MKFVVGENGRNPEKNLPRPRFVHHETHMESPRRELGTPGVSILYPINDQCEHHLSHGTHLVESRILPKRWSAYLE